jgi:hypothetical protein
LRRLEKFATQRQHVGVRCSISAYFTIDAGATLELSSGGAAPVIFNGNPATLKLDAPAAFTGPIGAIVVGDAIDLAGITASSATYSASTLTINETNGQKLVYNNVSGSLAGDAVTIASDGHGGRHRLGRSDRWVQGDTIRV